MAEEMKPTKPLVLAEVMRPLADALDEWALVREKVLDKIDLQAAGEARALAAEIRRSLAELELVETVAAGEDATRDLQRLRGTALELLARHK